MRLPFSPASLIAVYGLTVAFGTTGTAIQSLQEAGFRQHSLGRGEVGTAWFEESFGALYAIESIQVTPPDTQFKGRDHHLLVKLLEANGQWRTILNIPVEPKAALDAEIWARISLAPELTPEMEAFYERMGRNPASSDTYGYRLEATFRPPEPILAQGIRFEMEGAYSIGKAWTFWVKTDSFPSRQGGAYSEWRYRHVW